jgi:hypothetical protein
MLLYFNTAVWMTKIYIHPKSPTSLSEFFDRFTIGLLLPSWIVAAFAILLVSLCTVLALLPPGDETLEKWSI